MNKYKYQIIKLTKAYATTVVSGNLQGFLFHEIADASNVFPIQGYNNIHSFKFHVNHGGGINGSVNSSKLLTAVDVTEFDEFKISNYEIIGKNTPFKLFAGGTSLPIDEKFHEVNIPNNSYKIKLRLSQAFEKGGQFTGEIYLILRLNNVNPKEHFKNYFRYETRQIEITNSTAAKVRKFSFRPYLDVKKLRGIHVSFVDPKFPFVTGTSPLLVYTAYSGLGVFSGGIVGKLSLQLNNRKSNPILMPCKDYLFASVNRKVEFLELNEVLLKSAMINGFFVQDVHIPVTLPKYLMNITFKYEVN